jgi:hypothetical protein
MKPTYEAGVSLDRGKLMAIQHDEHQQRITLEGFFTLIESDPEHRYELIDGYPYMMTGGSPDHSIIGANMSGVPRYNS